MWGELWFAGLGLVLCCGLFSFVSMKCSLHHSVWMGALLPCVGFIHTTPMPCLNHCAQFVYFDMFNLSNSKAHTTLREARQKERYSTTHEETKPQGYTMSTDLETTTVAVGADCVSCTFCPMMT